MNSDIYSAALTGERLIVIVLDNGGFAVINKLQKNIGNESFNTCFADCRTVAESFPVDFSAHAEAISAVAKSVANPRELGETFLRSKAGDRTSVIVMQVDPHEGWTERGHAWWEIGTATVPGSEKVRSAHEEWEAGRVDQRFGL